MVTKIDQHSLLLVFGKVEAATIEKRMRGQALTQMERNYLSRSIRPKLRAAKLLTEHKILEEIQMKQASGIEQIEYNLNRYGYPLFALKKKKTLLFSPEELIAAILTKHRSPRYIEAIPFLFLKNKIDSLKMLALASEFHIKNEIGYLLETAFLIKPLPQLKKLLFFLKKNKDRQTAFLAEGDHEFLLKTTPERLKKWNLLGRFFDADFCLAKKEKKLFENLLDKKDKQWKIDFFIDGYIFSEQLPPDYVEIAKEIKRMNHIVLKALHPVDVIITKVARLNARDEEDISALVKFVNKEDLLKRFEKVMKTYAGKEEEYRYHMEIIVKRFFSSKK